MPRIAINKHHSFPSVQIGVSSVALCPLPHPRTSAPSAVAFVVGPVVSKPSLRSKQIPARISRQTHLQPAPAPEHTAPHSLTQLPLAASFFFRPKRKGHVWSIPGGERRTTATAGKSGQNSSPTCLGIRRESEARLAGQDSRPPAGMTETTRCCWALHRMTCEASGFPSRLSQEFSSASGSCSGRSSGNCRVAGALAKRESRSARPIAGQRRQFFPFCLSPQHAKRPPAAAVLPRAWQDQLTRVAGALAKRAPSTIVTA